MVIKCYIRFKVFCIRFRWSFLGSFGWGVLVRGNVLELIIRWRGVMLGRAFFLEFRGYFRELRRKGRYVFVFYLVLVGFVVVVGCLVYFKFSRVVIKFIL